jgi:hypothetical protein
LFNLTSSQHSVHNQSLHHEKLSPSFFLLFLLTQKGITRLYVHELFASKLPTHHFFFNYKQLIQAFFVLFNISENDFLHKNVRSHPLKFSQQFFFYLFLFLSGKFIDFSILFRVFSLCLRLGLVYGFGKLKN